MSAIVVQVSAKDKKQAKQITKCLLDQKLAACVQLLPVESMYTWEGKHESAKEVLLLIKTSTLCFKKLVLAVKSQHSYKTPEIIALPIIAGDKDYLKWIKSSTIRN